MSIWLALRLAKWIGMIAFTGGVLGAVLPRDLVDRRRAAYWLATPGLVLTWMSGYAMAEITAVSLGSPWLSASMLLSLVAFQAVVWGVERADRGRALVAAVALAALLSTVGLMVWRPGTLTSDHSTEEAS